MKKTWYGVFLIISLTICNGCGSEEKPQDTDENTQSKESVEETGADEDSFPVEITDATDETITIEEEPERIVSMIPSNTEIAFALGMGEEIVGVTDSADYPEEAKEKETIGGINFNVEKIISLEPDLVLAHASSLQQAEEGLQQLEEAGIKVLVVNEATSFESTYESIEMIGKAGGASKQADTIVSNMQQDVEELKKQAEEIDEEEKKTVWMEIQPPPNIYTTGKGTFMNEILNIINAENAAASEEGWIPYSAEEAVRLNPDVIVTTYGSTTEEDPKKTIQNRSGWENVPAVENGEIYDVNGDTVSRPAPRLTEGAEELAELVYPDVFAP